LPIAIKIEIDIENGDGKLWIFDAMEEMKE
jgi:hypothetical protein